MVAIKTYKTYMFTDKDPAIDQLRTIVQDSGESYAKIHELSGVADSTLYNWFHGDTRRPQNASIEAVARALGYRRDFVPMNAKAESTPEPKIIEKGQPAWQRYKKSKTKRQSHHQPRERAAVH